MRLNLVVAIASLIGVVALSVWFVGAASARTMVNPRCYNNRASKPGSLLWWADCANLWGPHAFTAAELRAARGRPRRVTRSGARTYVEYRNCVFTFNRRGQAIFGYCA
jgi:hypothetical protein